ncbi:hypothetical protein [Shivajiella indica]|uniref:Transposase n=1 Tax=Shivajiella indica TaxID=872115 RepID=A0ABW5BBE7_9BACT
MPKSPDLSGLFVFSMVIEIGRGGIFIDIIRYWDISLQRYRRGIDWNNVETGAIAEVPRAKRFGINGNRVETRRRY